MDRHALATKRNFGGPTCENDGVNVVAARFAGAPR